MSYPLQYVITGDLIFLEPGEGPFIVTGRDGDHVYTINAATEEETLNLTDYPNAQYYPRGAVKAAREFEASLSMNDWEDEEWEVVYLGR